MEYILENEYLKITVTEWGAQLKSVLCKADGTERMWQADPAVWGYHAPILFPHTGKVVDNEIRAKGGSYPAKQHGFAREMEHSFLDRSQDTLRFVLTENPDTLAEMRFNFRTFCMFDELIKNHWGKHNVLIGTGMDHGCHATENGKGTHGMNTPEDRNIIHFYKIYPAK